MQRISQHNRMPGHLIFRPQNYSPLILRKLTRLLLTILLLLIEIYLLFLPLPAASTVMLTAPTTVPVSTRLLASAPPVACSLTASNRPGYGRAAAVNSTDVVRNNSVVPAAAGGHCPHAYGAHCQCSLHRYVGFHARHLYLTDTAVLRIVLVLIKIFLLFLQLPAASTEMLPSPIAVPVYTTIMASASLVASSLNAS